LLFLACGFVWGILFNCWMSDSPTIELRKGILYEKEVDNIGFLVIGNYNPDRNHIKISLSSKDIQNTLIHEYGHYIYEVLNKKDRDYWDNELCNKSKKIYSYKDSQLCNEWFAIQFASYIQGNYDIPEREFMNMVYGYYLR